MEIDHYSTGTKVAYLWLKLTSIADADSDKLNRFLLKRWKAAHSPDVDIKIQKKVMVNATYTKTRDRKGPPAILRKYDILLIKDLAVIHENSKKAWNALMRDWQQHYDAIYVLTISCTYSIKQLEIDYYREKGITRRRMNAKRTSDDEYEEMLDFLREPDSKGAYPTIASCLEAFGKQSPSGLYNYVRRVYGSTSVKDIINYDE